MEDKRDGPPDVMGDENDGSGSRRPRQPRERRFSEMCNHIWGEAAEARQIVRERSAATTPGSASASARSLPLDVLHEQCTPRQKPADTKDQGGQNTFVRFALRIKENLVERCFAAADWILADTEIIYTCLESEQRWKLCARMLVLCNSTLGCVMLFAATYAAALNFRWIPISMAAGLVINLGLYPFIYCAKKVPGWISFTTAFLIYATLLCCMTQALAILCHVFFGGGGQDGLQVILFSVVPSTVGFFVFPVHPVRFTVALHTLRTVVVTVLLFSEQAYITATGQPQLMELPMPYVHRVIVTIFCQSVACIEILFFFRYAFSALEQNVLATLRLRVENRDRHAATDCIIHSLLPPQKASDLRASDPRFWFLSCHDKIEDVSVLQIDIKGFTALASLITAQELLDLVNAIFTSIDGAAESIGHIWKAETIGDCYKAVCGDFSGRKQSKTMVKDHAERALALACSIIVIVDGVTEKLGLQEVLSVRCGIASGSLTAAVVGKDLPRYLIYGETCQLANTMEEKSKSGCVLLAADAAKLLNEEGWCMDETSVVLGNGEHVECCSVALSDHNRKRMLAGAWGPSLDGVLHMFLQNVQLPEHLHHEVQHASPLQASPLQASARPSTQESTSKFGASASGVGSLIGKSEAQIGSGPLGFSSRASPEGTALARERAIGNINLHSPKVLEPSQEEVPQQTTSARSVGSEQPSVCESVRSATPVGAKKPSVSEETLLAGKQIQEGDAHERVDGVSVSETSAGVVGGSGVVQPGIDGGGVDSIEPGNLHLDVCEGRVDCGQVARDNPGSSIGARDIALAWCNGDMLARAQGGDMLVRERGVEWAQERGREREGQDTFHRALSALKGTSPLPVYRFRTSPSRSLFYHRGGKRKVLASPPRAPPCSPPRSTASRETPYTTPFAHSPSGKRLGGASARARAVKLDELFAELKNSGSFLDDEKSKIQVLSFEDLQPLMGMPILATISLASFAHALIITLLSPTPLFAIAPGTVCLIALILLVLFLRFRTMMRTVKAQALVTGFFLVSCMGFMGDYTVQCLQSSALWSFFGVLFNGGGGFRALKLSASVWLVILLGIHGGMASVDWFEGRQPGTRSEWWRFLVYFVTQAMTTTVFLVPLTIIMLQAKRDMARHHEALIGIQTEVKKQQDLLNVLVPPSISERLQQGETQIADRFLETTVMFVYIPDFEEIMTGYGVDATIDWLQAVFEALDNAMEAHHAENPVGAPVTKVESFNNFYMVVCGCGEDEKHAEMSVLCAKRMIESTSQVKQPNGKLTRLKVGLNSGPLCAGVIGLASPRFSIFGDTVNVGSRMASSAEASHDQKVYIHVSETTAERLDAQHLEREHGLRLEVRGEREVKGKGRMTTWAITKELLGVSNSDAAKREADAPYAV